MIRIASCLAVSLLFAGCGGGQSSSSETNSAPATQLQSTDVAPEVIQQIEFKKTIRLQNTEFTAVSAEYGPCETITGQSVEPCLLLKSTVKNTSGGKVFNAFVAAKGMDEHGNEILPATNLPIAGSQLASDIQPGETGTTINALAIPLKRASRFDITVTVLDGHDETGEPTVRQLAITIPVLSVKGLADSASP